MTTMTYEEWVDKFKPIQNELSDNASFEGMMFETYGAELDYVLSITRANPLSRVWTYIDGEGGTYIVEGYRLVNRIGYFITEVPYEEDSFYEIQVSEDEEETVVTAEMWERAVAMADAREKQIREETK